MVIRGAKKEEVRDEGGGKTKCDRMRNKKIVRLVLLETAFGDVDEGEPLWFCKQAI